MWHRAGVVGLHGFLSSGLSTTSPPALSNKAPVGTVIPNPHTGRVQMIVASSGPAGVGAWQSLKRNVLEDYRKAFNEDPGLLMSIGVLTDTDNTGESAEAWYGDIRLLPAGR